MKHLLLIAALAASPVAAVAGPLAPAVLAEARALREQALADDTALDLVRSLTTEVGPRPAGSPADARAVAWAIAKLKSLGFANVRAEPVTVPRWVRGEARAVATRSHGAFEAAKLGAVAMLMRSSGTASTRTPHTGAMSVANGPPPIPALALANPDADLLERQLASGLPVRVRLSNTAAWRDEAQSANVIGEIPGRELRDEVVLLGAHLDSWDLGTGAHDDAAGVGIVTAAARLAGGLHQRPRRTIRVVLFANEEFGLSGAKAYAASYASTLDRHVVGLESDSGAFQPYGLAARVGPNRLPLVRAMQTLLEPLGIAYLGAEANGGADLGPLRELGMPVIDLRSDVTPYFDLHHTADDTFDKVDPALLSRHVAAFAVIAWLAAEAEGGLGRLPVPAAAPAASR